MNQGFDFQSASVPCTVHDQLFSVTSELTRRQGPAVQCNTDQFHVLAIQLDVGSFRIPAGGLKLHFSKYARGLSIDFKPELPDDRYRALSYLDMAIEQLMLGLAERGLLDNTVVILTSDESSERSFENPLQDSIHLNWLPLVIVHPSKRHETIDNFIGAHRLSEILQAVIGDLNTSTLRALGQEAEPLIFGNAYSNKLFWFDPKAEELLFCNIADYHCAAFDNVPDPLALTERQPDRIRYFPMLREMIRALVEL